MTASEAAAAARHAAAGDPGEYERQVPDALNDLLSEQVPGRRNANFRLACRRAWVLSAQQGQGVAVVANGTQQAAVLERVVEMCREKT